MSIAKVFHKPLAWLCMVVLSAGLAGATTRPAKQKSRNSSKAHLSEIKSKSRRNTKTKKVRGQQVIDSNRARQIQTALIREHYLSGEPSGVWDQTTKDAMARYQSDHGWQTKTLPDSRALITLGLGPSHESAINAEETAPARVQPVGSTALPGSRQ